MKHHLVSCSTCVLCLSFMLSACSGGTPTAKTVAVAYVAHSQSHSMSIINIPADETISTIEIGDSSVTTGTAKQSSPQNVAVSPDGSRAYVTDGITSVWVVDTQSRAVVATIPTGTSPDGVVISPNGKNVYVTTVTCSTPPCASSVEVIDTATNAVTSTIPIGITTSVLLQGIAISSDGTRVYVASGIGNGVWAIDTSTNTVVATIHTTNVASADLSVSPDGSHVYTVGWTLPPFVDSYFVDVIDTKTNAQTATILLGNQDEPVRMAISPDGGHAYVSAEGGHVWVVDTTQNALMSTITVSPGNGLHGLAVTPDGSRVYVTCGNTNTVYVLSTATNEVLAAIPSNYPIGVAISGAN
jgi:YVTN family beta-propeller protein